MATLVECLVDKGGTGDYATLSLAEAGNYGATGADLVSNDEYVVCSCINTDDTEDTTPPILTGLTTDATRDVTITVPVAYRHSGVFPASGNVYRMVITANLTAMAITDSNITFEYFPLSCAPTSTGKAAIQITASATNILFDGCIIKQANAQASVKGLYVYYTASQGSPVVVARNSLFIGFTDRSIGITAADGGSLTADNCTVIDSGRGIEVGGGSGVLTPQNCLSFNCTDGYIGSMTNAINCGYTEGSDPGTDGVDLSGYLATPGDVFVNAAGGDYHLCAGSPCIGVGANLSGTFTNDIDGDTRSAWDIGADEYTGTVHTLDGAANTPVVSLVAALNVTSKVYYVDATAGNDSNAGLSEELAWKTIAKVNAASFNPGDQILFKKGEIWRETLTVPSSGSAAADITFGAYGSGNNPIIYRTDVVADESWSLYYDVGGVKIWTYTYAGLTPRGLTEGGSRRTNLYIGTDPETDLVDDLTSGPYVYTHFYYRKDSGAPTGTEVGRRRYAIEIDNKSYITVDSIDVRGPGASVGSTDARAHIFVAETCDSVTISNLTGTQSDTSVTMSGYRDGYNIYGPTNFNLTNVTAYDCQDTGLFYRGSGTVLGCVSHGHGLLNTDTGDSGGLGIQGGPATITGCEIYDIGRSDNNVDFAISVWEPTDTITITKNYLHDITCGGVQIYGEINAGANHQINYNIIDTFGTTSDGSGTAGKTSGIRLLYTDGVKVYNNVIANGGSAVTTLGIFLGNTATNLSIKNNSFYNNANEDIKVASSATTTGLASDYNQFFVSGDDYTGNWDWKGTACDTIAAWRTAASVDANSATGDPLFVNAAGADFTLQRASPCINAGVDVSLTTDYAGNPILGNPDIGAYELSFSIHGGATLTVPVIAGVVGGPDIAIPGAANLPVLVANSELTVTRARGGGGGVIIFSRGRRKQLYARNPGRWIS